MRIKNSLKNIYSGIIGQVICLLCSFITRTFFIRILGSTYLGVSGLFGNILTLLSLAELGVGQAIIFSLYKPLAENDNDKIHALMLVYKKIYRLVFWFVLCVGMALVPFLKYIINDFDKYPDITIIYMMYVVNSAASYLFVYKSTLTVAAQKNFIVNKINYAFSLISMLCQLAVLIVFKNFLVYLGVQITATICQNIVIAHKTDKLFPFLKEKKEVYLEKEEKQELKKNVKSLMIYKIGSLALNSTDNIIISAFVGLIKVGIYSNYTLICSSVTSFLTTIFGNLTASIGNLNAVETNEKKAFMFNVINLATFWLYGVCSTCIFCVANSFINVWIGEEYLLTYRELFVIVLNMYVGGMLFAPFNYRQTMGLFVYGKWRPVISAVINLVVSVILCKRMGLEGVLWGTIIARATTNVWFDPYIIFKKGMEKSPLPYFADYLTKLLILFFAGGISFFASSFIPTANYFMVVVKAAAVFVLCNAMFFLFFGRKEEIKYFYTVIKSFVDKRKEKKA